MSNLITDFLAKNNHLKIEKIINENRVIVSDDFGFYSVSDNGTIDCPVRVTTVNPSDGFLYMAGSCN